MKTLLFCLLLTTGVVYAQSVPLIEGQYFPFREGIAMSKSTVDSTRKYVSGLEDSLFAIKRQRSDLIFQLSSFRKDQGQYDQALNLCQVKMTKTIQENKNLTEQLQRKTSALRTRFWIGTTAGIAIAFAFNSLIKK